MNDTPLAYVSLKGTVPGITLLIEAGADINAHNTVISVLLYVFVCKLCNVFNFLL